MYKKLLACLEKAGFSVVPNPVYKIQSGCACAVLEKDKAQAPQLITKTIENTFSSYGWKKGNIYCNIVKSPGFYCCYFLPL